MPNCSWEVAKEEGDSRRMQYLPIRPEKEQHQEMGERRRFIVNRKKIGTENRQIESAIAGIFSLTFFPKELVSIEGRTLVGNL